MDMSKRVKVGAAKHQATEGPKDAKTSEAKTLQEDDETLTFVLISLLPTGKNTQVMTATFSSNQPPETAPRQGSKP